jgi:hypothetical protein
MKNSESTNTVKSNIVREPIGRITGRINKVFFKALKKRLSYLGIEHSFFPLLLIGLGNGELTQQDLADKLMIMSWITNRIRKIPKKIRQNKTH